MLLDHAATFGNFTSNVKRLLLVSSRNFCYTPSMAETSDETLDDLLDAAGLPISVIARKAKMSARTILAMRKGEQARARVATVAKLAKVLGVTPAVLRAAIEASRAARPRP